MAYSADVNPGDDILASHYNNLRKDAVPDGAIIMWSGLLADIPTGWHLCDGTSGTPDLRAKFVRGAPAATEAGGTGGADTVALATGNLPAHTHGATGNHTHDIDVGESAGGLDKPYDGAAGFDTHPTSSDGSHTHNSVGSGTAHENRPAYYQILYIMKVA